MIDLLDENGFKPLNVLKNDPGFKIPNWFTYFRLKIPTEKFKRPNLTGVTLPSDRDDLTPLDYIPCACKAFKRIKKGSGYYRRILVIQKPQSPRRSRW